MTMQERLKAVVTMAFIIVIGLIVFAFGIGGYKTMPDYAGVYLAHTTKTYVPLPCVRKWKEKPGRVEAELATAGDARKLGYRIEDGCQEYLMGEQQSLATLYLYLSDWGVLTPPKQWWDQSYRTDAGMVDPRPKK
jgi:hypothetical protein